MKTKFLGIMVVIALLVSLVGIRQVGAADAAPFVSVRTVDGYVGEYEEYHISFLLSRDVKAHETLSVVFDDSITRAGVGDIAAGNVLIDTMPAGSSSLWSGHVLTVSTPINLSGGTVHELTILRGAMVQNPWTATHVQLLFKDDTTGTTLTSNFYGITTVTEIAPVSLTVDTSGASHLTVLLRFRTGRTGALVGAPATRSASAVTSDTITIRLSPVLSQVWDLSGGPVAWFSIAGTILQPRRLQLVSLSDRSRQQPTKYQKQATYVLDTSVGASTEVLVRLEFDEPAGMSVPLTTDDFALVWTSKEQTMVRLPLTGVPAPAPDSVDDNPVLPADVTVPVITWKVQQSRFSSRLVMLDIAVIEENLDEAWFSGGTGSFIHTRLATGDNTVFVINRSGIHGTVVATDMAGNTTTVSIDLPAPSGT
ncbi:MAG: hypothetical protein NTX94_06785 [Caldiserica bacterium]|nr:hypothetical protein [Caldisericota bacterium]